MGIAVNGETSSLKRTANLPAFASFSLWGWFNITDRNDFSTALSIAGGSGEYITFETDGTGTDFKIWATAMGPQTIFTVTAGVWYFIGMTVSGTTGTALYRAITSAALTSVAFNPSTSFTPGSVGWGTYPGEFMEGITHACGMADVPLTAAELQQISMYHEPQWLGIRSLNCFFPCIEATAANAVIDRSGNARNATATVSALAASPPLLWRPTRPMYVVPAVAATSFNPAWARGANTMIRAA